MFKRALAILFSVTVLEGCVLFDTREPESPISTNSTYIQPTSEQIVLQNFVNSITERNVENYLLNFSDSTKNSLPTFVFEPSNQALLVYQQTFLDWNLQKERQSFISLMSKIPSDSKPTITFRKQLTTLKTPDSTVMELDYETEFKHTAQSIPTKTKGSMRVVYALNNSQLWFIKKWSDIRTSDSDTSTTSWSVLKAIFVN